MEFIDARPDDAEARELGWFRAPDMLGHPDVHSAFVEFFEPRLREGFVTTSVDLSSFNPLAPSASPMPGLVQLDNTMIYDPLLAKTAREMRDGTDDGTTPSAGSD